MLVSRRHARCPGCWGAALLLLLAGCDSTPVSPNASSARPFVTSDSVFSIAADQTVRIPFTFANRSLEIVYIPACNGQLIPPEVQQERSGRVTTVSSPGVSGCAVEAPTPLAPGESLMDTAVVVTGIGGIVVDTASRYRLSLLAFAFDVNPDAPSNHLIGEFDRTSTEFLIRP